MLTNKILQFPSIVSFEICIGKARINKHDCFLFSFYTESHSKLKHLCSSQIKIVVKFNALVTFAKPFSPLLSITKSG